MVEISFLAGQLAVLFGWILFRGTTNLIRKRFDWKNEAKQLFFLINLLVLYRITFHPFSKVDGQVQPLIFDVATAWPFRFNLIPFINILDYESTSEILLNIIGNFTMFIPTGIIVPLIYKKFNSLGKTVLFGAMLSLVIEIIQLPFAVRASDIDDLILNTAGCVLGYGILSLCRKSIKSITRYFLHRNI